jgi:pilus assembly protein CpaC
MKVMSNKRKLQMGRTIGVLVGGSALVLAMGLSAGAQNAAPASQPSSMLALDGAPGGQLKLTVNKTAVIKTSSNYKRISVGSPEVADFNAIGPNNILVTGKKAGTTQLIIWDESEHSQVVDITVDVDLQTLHNELQTMFPESKIEASSVNGVIALRGSVPSVETAQQAVALASPYSTKVLNFLEISGGKQVLLQVRFAEVSRSASSQLGINFNYASGAFVGGSNIGQINPGSRMPADGVVGQAPPFNGIDLNGATPVNPSVTLYGAGQVGNFYLEYFIQTLRQNNLLRMLAEPNLIAASGHEANFLAGGEFPVPVTQGGGGSGVAVTVEYREFGVRLHFVPVILGNGRIRLQVSPEVSDLDFTTAVRLNGFVIPGLTSRKLDTVVELGEGQTFAIGGLLNNSIVANKDVTPGLGDLPVIGTLFRSVRYQRKETELVVLVTPRLVSAMNPEQVPAMPGEKWRDPNENDLFFNRDLGGEAPATRVSHRPTTMPNTPPARFRGAYGFTPAAQSSASADR